MQPEDSNANFDRSDSIMTTSQRKRLALHNEDPDTDYTPKHRQRIRERVLSGTKDLGLLFRKFEQRDIKQVFEVDSAVIEDAASTINEVQKSIERCPQSISPTVHPGEAHSKYEDRLSEQQDISTHIDETENNLESLNSELNQQNSELRSAKSEASPPEDRIEEIQARREDIKEDIAVREETLESLQEERKAIEDELNQMENSCKERIIKIQAIRSWLSDAQDSLTSIESNNLPDYISATLDELNQHLSELLAAINNITESINAKESEPEELMRNLDEVSDQIDQYNSSLDRSQKIADNLLDSIDRTATMPQFDPQRKEAAIEAIGFYLRVSDILNESAEDLLREAIIRTYTDQQPRKVVGDVSVNIETANREEAAKRAQRKLNRVDREHLSSAELRALAETDYQQLARLTVPQSEAAFQEWILDNLTAIDDEMELIEREPRSSNQTLVPDAIARNEDSKLILIEIKRDGDRGTAIEELVQYIDEYGGTERAQGLFVTLDDSGESEPTIEVHELIAGQSAVERSINLDEFRERLDTVY